MNKINKYLEEHQGDKNLAYIHTPVSETASQNNPDQEESQDLNNVTGFSCP